MDYKYVVEVRDFVKDIIIERLVFEDANTAYHEKRICDDFYSCEDNITVTLIEPDI